MLIVWKFNNIEIVFYKTKEKSCFNKIKVYFKIIEVRLING